MKKLTIIIISVLFSTSTQALVFEKCYDAGDIAFDVSKLPFKHSYDLKTGKETKSADGKSLEDYKLEAFYKYKKKYNKRFFDSDMYETWQYKVFTKSKTIQSTYVLSDKEFIKQKEISKKKNLSELPKINKFKYQIYSVTDNYIEAGKSKSYIRLNISNGTVMLSADSQFTKGLLLFHCDLQNKNKNYLDYWWAVILIIAITFFIFTQSGKRLKQIRRK